VIVLLLVFVVFICAAIGNACNQKYEQSQLVHLTPEEGAKLEQVRKVERERKAAEATLSWNYGNVSPQMICPHCQERSGVRSRAVTRKQGVSGGKATAAVLTGGVSLLAVGLSRKEQVTQAHCCNCDNTWFF